MKGFFPETLGQKCGCAFGSMLYMAKYGTSKSKL